MADDSQSTELADKKRAAPSTAWKKGQSGNPGGRRKVAPEVEESLFNLTPMAIRIQHQMLKDYENSVETPDGQQKVPASVARAITDSIIDRTMGKAPAAPEDNDAISRGLGFTRDEVAQMLLGRRLPERDEDPLAIPATTKE